MKVRIHNINIFMLAIIQARMTSQRLPGKVMMPIVGQTMLERVILRVKSASLVTKLVVATSSDESDDKICDFCAASNVKYFRGSLNDVYSRYCDLLRNYKADAFIRISADSPLIDPAIIDRAIKYYQNGTYDLVTNTFPRSFPKGQSVEVINADSFLRMGQKANLSMAQSEHVTEYFYANPLKFSIFNFSAIPQGSYELHNQSVDSLDDFIRVSKLIEVWGVKGHQDWLSAVKHIQSFANE